MPHKSSKMYAPSIMQIKTWFQLTLSSYSGQKRDHKFVLYEFYIVYLSLKLVMSIIIISLRYLSLSIF